MEELRHALHAAADDPPPTRIDLDQLIEGTRRRTRRQYRLGAIAGAAVLTAGTVLVPSVMHYSGMGSGTAGGGGGAPPVCPTWEPSAPRPAVPSESIGVVAGPSYDPSVPEASRNATPEPPIPSPEFSPSSRGCRPAETVRPCVGSSDSITSSGSQPDNFCFELAPRVLDLVRGTFAPEWRLSTAQVEDGALPAYAVNAVLVNGGGQTMIIAIQVRVQAPGDLGAECAAVVAAAGINDRPCAVQAGGGDALMVGAHDVVDVRRDGTVVTVTGTMPATVAQLTTLARSPKVGVAN